MDEVFRKRHSVRHFLGSKVTAELLSRIVEAADSAPSAGDLKAREMVVVTDDSKRRELVKAAWDQDFIFEAPAALVFFAVPKRSAWRYGARGEGLYSIQDATIAASFAWLQAVSLGLSACWVGSFDDNEVIKILNAPDDWRPVCIMPVGYEAK